MLNEVATSLGSPVSSEAELVEGAKAHSPEAWTQIYNRYYPSIFRYAKARVFDESAAEDIASAVFVGALKGIDSYKYRGRPLLAWLYRIARNVTASHQREMLGRRGDRLKRSLDLPRRVTRRLMRRGGRDDAGGGEEDGSSIAGGEGDPATLVEGLDLREALAKLPASQREVVILRFVVGLSGQEVAEAVGKEPSAVYSLQARAIVALREQLK